MAKILVAEDDSKLSEMISVWLSNESHTVEVVGDGAEAQNLLKLSVFDILILDWTLPSVTGIEICKNYRKDGGMCPILILTGKREVENKEQGLDSGADDYLTKPFHFKELSARVRALLRRPATVTPKVLKYRGISLDPAAVKVTKDARSIDLYPKEFAILEFFMRHPDQVLSLEALQNRIWPSDSESSPETLRVYITWLRNKIETKGERPIIRTVHRQGYIFDTSES